MKKLLALLLTVIMTVSCMSLTSFALIKDAEYHPIDVKAFGFDYDSLFIDGRTITEEEISEVLNLLSPYIVTLPDGTSHIGRRCNFYLVAELTEEEKNGRIGIDEANTAAFLTRLGYNSEYFMVIREDSIRDFRPGAYGENEYPFIIILNQKAYDELGLDKLSYIQELYLEALLYAGQKYDTEMILGASPKGSVNIDLGHDVNLDGEVTAKDIKALKQSIAGFNVLINPIAADQNGDGEVTAKDLKALKLVIAN